MADGWVKLHRKLLGSCIFQNEKILKVFVWCLLKATHSDHEQIIGRSKINLEPGQFIFGRQKAADALGMSQSTVWEYMKLLESSDTISIKSNNKYSVVTVVNWASYQFEEENSDNKKTAEKQQTDNKKTTNGQQKDTNKNVKNGKKEKNGKNTLPKIQYADSVTLTEEEYIKLVTEHGQEDVRRILDILSNYKLSSGKKYKSDYHAILNWVVKRLTEEKRKNPQTIKKDNRPKSFDAIDQWDKMTEGLIE